ncbi:MAG: HD domain-containing protein [Deltaproteobacteria bacterium]|nr:HD domain-containing protein [Deltaproteobacteria bacterium]
MIVRDPVHGLIYFDRAEDALLIELLDSMELQRLRRIRQLGVTFLAFPGAEHSRFTHAVGALHVMRRLCARIDALGSDVPSELRLDRARRIHALAAALLHDLGHGPFSHLYEDVFPGGRMHESWTIEALRSPGTQVNRVLCRFDATLPERIAAMVQGSYEPSYLRAAVSGPLDVDRFDYLLRDSHMTGARYGLYDLDWLLHSLCFAGSTLAVDGRKGIAAVEQYFLARRAMFEQVYFHKTTRAAEWVIRSIFRRVASLVADGRDPAGLPGAIRAAARADTVSLEDYLALDDARIWTCFTEWAAGSTDAILRDLCDRLLRRALFKTVELDDPSNESVARAAAIARDRVRAAGLDPDLYCGIDRAVDVSYLDPSEPLEEVWVWMRDSAPRKLGDVSEIIGRLRGRERQRVRLVVAAEVRDRVRKDLEAAAC